MSTSTTTVATRQPLAASTTDAYGREFWEHLWRTAGLQSVGCFVGAYFVYGYQPEVAAIFAGMGVLNLMWFAAAIRTTLIDAGQDGWGAGATASSAAVPVTCPQTPSDSVDPLEGPFRLKRVETDAEGDRISIQRRLVARGAHSRMCRSRTT